MSGICRWRGSSTRARHRPGYVRCPVADPRIREPSCPRTRAQNPLLGPNPCLNHDCRPARVVHEWQPIRGDGEHAGGSACRRRIPSQENYSNRHTGCSGLGSLEITRGAFHPCGGPHRQSPRGTPTHSAIRSGRSALHSKQIPPIIPGSPPAQRWDGWGDGSKGPCSLTMGTRPQG